MSASDFVFLSPCTVQYLQERIAKKEAPIRSSAAALSMFVMTVECRCNSILIGRACCGDFDGSKFEYPFIC